VSPKFLAAVCVLLWLALSPQSCQYINGDWYILCAYRELLVGRRSGVSVDVSACCPRKAKCKKSSCGFFFFLLYIVNVEFVKEGHEDIVG
jgi:hypothetical protein